MKSRVIKKVANKLSLQVLAKLPIKGLSHSNCMVELSNGDVMLLGGYPNDARKAAFILHMANMTWTQKASMRLGRHELACGAVRNLQTGKEEVVAVGGSCTDVSQEDKCSLDMNREGIHWLRDHPYTISTSLFDFFNCLPKWASAFYRARLKDEPQVA